MDVRMREYARSTELFANRSPTARRRTGPMATDAQRVESGALEVVVYGTLGQVLAASSAGATSTNLPRASAEVIARDRCVAASTGAWSRCRKTTT